MSADELIRRFGPTTWRGWSRFPASERRLPNVWWLNCVTNWRRFSSPELEEQFRAGAAAPGAMQDDLVSR